MVHLQYRPTPVRHHTVVSLVVLDIKAVGITGIKGCRHVSIEVGGLRRRKRADDILAEIGRSPGQPRLSRSVWAVI